MKFKWIVALSALFIAGCAAAFSVSGIAMLFSGSLIGVAVMASSLEIGKLVAASYLHRNWNKLSKLFKYYMSFAVMVLVFITSLGIFGFLSNAYQETALRVDQVEGQVQLLEQRRSGFESEIERNENRINVLTDQRDNQEARYDTLIAGEDWINARRTYNMIESSDEEIKELRGEINASRDSVNSIQTRILEIRNANMDLAREIGGFKFVAEAFDVPIETAVKWFIILLIFVFDPLAVSLVIAFNSYVKKEEVGELKEVVEKRDLGKVSDKAQKEPNEKQHTKKWYKSYFR